ncbi:hypothetical protein NKH18_19835 [Streptomyces sp. M10(2022)]
MRRLPGRDVRCTATNAPASRPSSTRAGWRPRRPRRPDDLEAGILVVGAGRPRRGPMRLLDNQAAPAVLYADDRTRIVPCSPATSWSCAPSGSMPCSPGTGRPPPGCASRCGSSARPRRPLCASRSGAPRRPANSRWRSAAVRAGGHGRRRGAARRLPVLRRGLGVQLVGGKHRVTVAADLGTGAGGTRWAAGARCTPPQPVRRSGPHRPRGAAGRHAYLLVRGG